MKGTPERIILGSGKNYVAEFDPDKGLPSHTEVCVPENLLGLTKGGAELTYNEETHEEKDDHGLASKVITISEEALLKLGVFTMNGNTLKKLADRCQVTEKDGLRTIKIGGAGNAQNKSWVVCFHHEDAKDGDIWVMIVGRNTAGLTLTFAVDNATKAEPQFKALPQDDKGTLITIIEEMDAAEAAAEPAAQEEE